MRERPYLVAIELGADYSSLGYGSRVISLLFGPEETLMCTLTYASPRNFASFGNTLRPRKGEEIAQTCVDRRV